MDQCLRPPLPHVDLHGYLENPPSPLGHPHGLWMFPKTYYEISIENIFWLRIMLTKIKLLKFYFFLVGSELDT